MSDILIVVGSVTNAARVEKRLLSYGDPKTRVVGTPTELGGGGCSYSVVASLSSENFVRANKRSFSVKGIYLIENHFGKRYYHDIS